MADCTQGIENREKIIALEKRSSDIETNLKSMSEDVKEIREKLIGRPSWIILTIFSFLTGLCGVLASWTFAVTKLLIEAK